MMKWTNLILLLFLFVNAVAAQQNPVSWSFDAKKINDQEYDLVLTASVANGWYIYSQYLDSDEGPIPTTFKFEPDTFELVDKTREEGRKKEGFDELFGMNIVKFSGKVQFIQRIKLTGSLKVVKGNLEYMTCDDESCLPPTDVPFEIPLK